MRLNHLDLTVPDSLNPGPSSRRTWGFVASCRCGDDDFAVLTDEAGFALTLNNLDKARPVDTPAH